MANEDVFDLLSPLRATRLAFRVRNAAYTLPCSGQPLEFTLQRSVEKTMQRVRFAGVHLADYQF